MNFIRIYTNVIMLLLIPLSVFNLYELATRHAQRPAWAGAALLCGGLAWGIRIGKEYK